MKKRYWWVLGAVVVVAVAGGWVASRRGPKPTPVQFEKVARQDLQAKVTANGKVQAQKKVDISATIMGQVTHIAVEEGEAVKKGDFLLQIDPANPRAMARAAAASMKALRDDLEAAKSNRDQARIDFDRAKKNWAEKIIAEADYQRAKTGLDTSEAAVASARGRLEQAQASLEGAQDSLGKTTVRAPMDGIVTAKRVEEGEVAVIGIQNSPGTVLMTISDMSTVETELEVDETSIPSVKLGQQARVRVDAYPNKTFEGVVTEVGSSPLLKTGSTDQAIKFKVKVQIKNPPEGIKPGLSCQADILTGFRPDALAVPLQALIVRETPKEQKTPGGQPGDPEPPKTSSVGKDPGNEPPTSATGPRKEEEGVYVADNDVVRFQRITTGLIGELSIEVTEGLKGGETIVTGPFKALRALKPGDKVIEEKKPAGLPAGA